MRFATGVVVGTLFGRTILRTTIKVIPKSTRQKIYDKSLERVTEFTRRRVTNFLEVVDRKLDERPSTERYRHQR